MPSFHARRFTAFLLPLAVLLCGAAPALPDNLAYSARISANSEHSPDYAAALVADGRIPAMGSRGDTGQAWCVNGALGTELGELVFAWDAPVTVAEVVYHARNAWLQEDSWRRVALFADGAETPFHEAALEMRDGPQRIALSAPVQLRELRLRFTESFGGPNPGASEVQIFAESPDEGEFRALLRRAALRNMPWVDRVDPDRLEALIRRLAEAHGAAYPQAQTHLGMLAELRDKPGNGEALARLQRAALLFDVDRLLVIKRHEIVASHVYTYHYEGFQAGGGLYVTSPHDEAPALTELVLSPTGQILDCDLSYDGRTALFSWRQTGEEGYHLWTVNVDGTGLRQITEGPWHDYNGCWLPDGGVAFLSTRTAQFAYCWHAPVGVVHRMDADGGNVRCLSANYLNDFTPYVLEDGRILFSRWEYVDRPAIPIQSLWTMNPDGTTLAGYFGNRVLSPGTFMEARSIPGTGKIVCTMTGHNGPTRGALGVVDRSLGNNAQEAIVNITPDVPVPGVNEGNGNTDGSKQYSCPLPLDAERLLLSAQGPVLARDFDGNCVSLVLPVPEDGMQYFSAQPVRPRPRPPVIAPAAPPQNPDEPAVVTLQDVYAGLGPKVRRGDVARLRIVREMPKTVRIDPALRAFGFQFPVVSCGATYAPKDVLGEVPVEPDGSARFLVPAGIPVYFMALDAEGRALQRMRSFTHFMPGERQGCVGCHEPRLQTPRARRSLAAEMPPRVIEPPEWGAGGFSYPGVVQPVLDRHCVECHHPHRAEGGLDLTGSRTDFFNVSYEMLAREPQGPAGSPHVSWIPTYNGQEQNILQIEPLTWGSPASKLAELVRNGHPDREGRPQVDMTDAEKRRIYAWIDLNVPYYHTSETSHPDIEGCRRIYSPKVDETLNAVAARRCAECHTGGVPRHEWTRVTEPALNPFLLAPLARAAGGTERCGAAVFTGTDDPDYQAILATLTPLEEGLRKHPRTDMPGAVPAPDVCRDRY
ncbi:MAG: hypothetical protein GX580_09955 [Candidatus Hydrogenedens sp.]|nr:hypothetical protein [Candidatus Hydrogenedens sp.]